jgi:D-alanyl-lipoteichoic acid acyltransferase DltB (MBOAT superfamily)
MLFNSTEFVLFLLLALLVYWLLPWLRARHLWLVVASLAFYAWWDWRFVPLIVYVTLIAYGAARAVHAWPRHARKWVVLTLLLQLGQLAVFKYTNFVLASIGDISRLLGGELHPSRLSIILPIGVSFYTFHGISYVVDVYRGKLKEPQSLLVVALYIVFFPQLVAGPIVRADTFIPQTQRPARLDTRDLIAAAKLIGIGLICKSVFADRLAPLVDAIFQTPERFDNWTLSSAALGFYAQIYFDFVGYSTMAIGFSRLFGYRLPRNFDYPYRSTSITEFWRRWHISLSSWLRDYLYIPLGGNRGGSFARYRNLLLTMLLGGLWHGASYNFVLWGGLHGLGLALHKLFRTRFPTLFSSGPLRYAWLPLAWLLTQVFVLVTWVPFRAQSFADTRTFLGALSLQRGDLGLVSQPLPLGLLFIPIVTEHLLLQNPKLAGLAQPRRPYLALAVAGVCLALTLPWLELKVQSFIYFQF